MTLHTAALRLTKLQLRNLYKFLSLRLLLPFFFNAIELNFVYGVKKKTKEIGPETKICIGCEVARAPLACLWSGGHWRCEKCEIKRKTEPVGPVSSQNLSFWWFGSLSAKTRLAEMTHRSQILWIRWNSLPFCHIQRKYFVIPKAAVSVVIA